MQGKDSKESKEGKEKTHSKKQRFATFRLGSKKTVALPEQPPVPPPQPTSEVLANLEEDEKYVSLRKNTIWDPGFSEEDDDLASVYLIIESPSHGMTKTFVFDRNATVNEGTIICELDHLNTECGDVTSQLFQKSSL
jgi:hypothetical protein